MEIPARASCLQFMILPIKNDIDDPVTIISCKIIIINVKIQLNDT